MQTSKLHPQVILLGWLPIILGLTVLAWLGIVDKHSTTQLTGSLNTAGLIYGTARGINALVSLLQGTEVNALVLTFSIGEVLDPINDLIERFSAVILFALGSLALQKILLAVVSDTLFNAALTLAGAGALVAAFTHNRRTAGIWLRLFLLVAFVRFSLALVVLANSWVDAAFLSAADEQRHAAMSSFQDELRQVDSLTRAQADAESRLADIEEASFALDSRRAQTNTQLLQLDARLLETSNALDKQKAAAGGLCNLPVLTTGCPEEVQQTRRLLAELEQERSILDDMLAAIDAEAALLQDQAECAQQHQRGEPCDLWERLTDTPSANELRQKLDKINADLGDFAENSVSLLMSLLLKTVVIPIAFLYLLLQVLRASWARL